MSSRPRAAGRRVRAIAVLAAAAFFRCAHGPAPVALRPDHAEMDVVEERHRVEAGQTLYRIAKQYGVTVDELVRANRLKRDDPLAVGQELIIPREPEPVSKPGDGPPAAVGRLGSPAGSGGAGRDDGEPPPTRTLPAFPTRPPARTGVLSWPLRGVLYGKFGKKGKEPHDGIDLAAPSGTPVGSAAEGVVLYAGEQRGYGLVAIVEHADGLITLYAHNRDLRVKTGQRVRAGQVVATVGESGRTSGPHLHFEVRKEGVPVDPLDYLGPPPESETR